jgi:hypothetical protein
VLGDRADAPEGGPRLVDPLGLLLHLGLLLAESLDALVGIAWIASTSVPISRVASAVRSASLRISSAITANPLPCSPARTDSIVAFRASMSVRLEMPLISSTIVPISTERSPSRLALRRLTSTRERSRSIPSITVWT